MLVGANGEVRQMNESEKIREYFQNTESRLPEDRPHDRVELASNLETLIDFRPDTLRLPVSGAAASDSFFLIILKYGLFVASGAPASSLTLSLRFSFSSALSSSMMRS
jgi:hypothetical protein